MAVRWRRRKWALWAALVAGSGYATYRLYTSEAGKRKRQQLMRLFSAILLLGDAAEQSAESVAIISADLKRFLLSDEDELPGSIRQALKITHSPDFQHSCTLLSAALTRGLLRGFTSPRPKPPLRPFPLADDPPCTEVKEIYLNSCSDPSGPEKGRQRFTEKSECYPTGSKVIGSHVSFDKTRQQSESTPWGELPERLLGKFFSEPGVNFASAVVGNGACNIVKALFDGFENQRGSAGEKGDANSRIVEVLCTPQCKGFINESIQMIVTTTVAAYIDKTRGVNFYEEMVAGITNPSHKDPMKDILTTTCNGAVETFVKSCHSAMFGKKSGQLESQVSQQGSRDCTIEELSDGLQIQTQMGLCMPSTSYLKSISHRERIRSDDGNVHTSLDSPEDTLILSCPRMEGITEDPEIQKLSSCETTGKLEQEKNGIHNFINEVSKTLAIPSNHRLVVDVAGTMTSEAVRSLVDVLVSTISSNVQGQMQRGWERVKVGAVEQVNAIQAQAKYKDVAVKALFLASICLAICLHMLTGIHTEKV